MNDQNKNQTLAISLEAQAEVWQNFRLALVFTSALVNLYAIIAVIVLTSLS